MKFIAIVFKFCLICLTQELYSMNSQNILINQPSFDKIVIKEIQGNVEQLLKEHKKVVDTILIEKVINWNSVVVPMEQIETKFGNYWNVILHLHSVQSKKDIRDQYKKSLPLISDYYTKLGQNKKLYEILLTLQKDQTLTKVQKKHLANEIRDFKLSGVALNVADKEEFKKLQADLTKLENKFEENVLDATQAWFLNEEDIKKLDGIPEYAIKSAQAKAQDKKLKGYVFTLDIPSYLAVLRHANNRDLREKMYYAFVTKASELGNNKFNNTPVMDKILKKRKQMAKLLGFDNYAQYSIVTKMVSSTEQVISFLEDLALRAKSQAKKELSELTGFAKTYSIDKIEPWDLIYLEEKYKAKNFGLAEDEIRQYFPQETVVQGLFKIVNRVFGLQVKSMQSNVWHSDIRAYAISDKDNKLRGIIYFDLFARENKRSGAWMADCTSRLKLANGQYQCPIAFLSSNFTPANANEEALFSHDDVITLFHEFGHSLHHILTKVDVLALSGINGVPWDCVELPSQFLENWAWQEESLKMCSKHYKTNKPLPKELLQKLLKAKNYNSAMHTLKQLEYALFDFKLHLNYDQKKADYIQATINDVRKKLSVIDTPQYNRFANSFAHIFAGGYAAGYYSYKWAELLSSDAFGAFEENSIFSENLGQSFMNNILEKGGSEEPSVLFKAFRKRDPSIDALLRSSGIES